MNSKLSPYEILGVKNGANIDECSIAYKELAKKYHPDLNPNDIMAQECMKQINQAYQAIKSGNVSSFSADDFFSKDNNNVTNAKKTDYTEPVHKQYDSYTETDTDNINRNSTINNSKKSKNKNVLSKFVFNAFLSFAFIFLFSFFTKKIIIPLINYNSLSMLIEIVANKINSFDFIFADTISDIVKPDINRLSIIFPNLNTALYFQSTKVLLIVSSVSSIFVFAFDFIKSISFIIVLKTLPNTKSFFQSLNKAFVYLTYAAFNISLIIYAITFCHLTFMVSVYFFYFGQKIYWYLIIFAISLIPEFVVWVFIIKKKALNSFQWLCTKYFLGILITFLPVPTLILLASIIIIAIIVLTLVLVASALFSTSDSDDRK